jgi:hypothetical protein
MKNSANLRSVPRVDKNSSGTGLPHDYSSTDAGSGDMSMLTDQEAVPYHGSTLMDEDKMTIAELLSYWQDITSVFRHDR